MKRLILTLGFCFSAANAATISPVVPKADLDGKTFLVEISGDINAGDAANFTNLVGKIRERELIVTLNSAGGSVAEGELMIDQLLLLRQSGVKVTTVVRNGAQCGSMCLPVFMAGQERRAGEVSAFYFHGVLPSHKHWMSGSELFKEGNNFVTHLDSRLEKKSGQCLSRWPDRPR